MSTLKSRAVLMRLSIGLPGEQRQDKQLTSEVKAEKSLGDRSGKWEKFLYPVNALEPIKKLDGKARAYHNAVTLAGPFGDGVGILPAALIMEYADKMRDFANQRAVLVADHFIAQFDQWVNWARTQHNGTFDGSLYDKDEAAQKFYFKTEPMPVPSSTHFEDNVTSLLGIDADAVDKRVADAEVNAQRELLKRMIEPVAHMAATLKKDAPRIFDTLIGNVEEIARLAPKLNLTGDVTIDGFVSELEKLTRYSSAVLRDDKATRDEARVKAEAVLAKLSGYKL